MSDQAGVCRISRLETWTELQHQILLMSPANFFRAWLTAFFAPTSKGITEGIRGSQMSRDSNFAGRRFGNLTVVQPTPGRKNAFANGIESASIGTAYARTEERVYSVEMHMRTRI